MRRSLISILVVFCVFSSSSMLSSSDQDDHKTFANSKFPITIKEIIAQFSLVEKNPNSFFIGLDQDTTVPSEKNKKYFKPLWDITKFNLLLWAFDKYVLKGTWTNISFQTVSDNLKTGLIWDYDDFGTNQFGHAYHGAMYHSIARSQGMSFLESSIYTFIGSLTWEFFWESEYPGKNDHYFSTFGGIHLGEALYRMANLISYENATGFSRTLGKAFKFLVNPIVGLSGSSGKDFDPANLGRDHDYDFRLPLGAYHSSDDQFVILVATRFEYKDGLQNDGSKLRPYDWFSFDAQIGINEQGFRDPEVSTYGILFGKKFQNGCAGLFGLFDYVNSHVAEQMSAVGIGPGFATSSLSESKLFLKSSGILSFVFGSSSATIPYSEPNYEQEGNEPYHFGPGIMGKIKFELGKKGLGSIYTGFSQYWVHATLADANEFMSVISFDLNYDMSETSQLSLGYDYYFRNGRLENQRLTRSKNAIRAMYVINF
ncbi:MAG: DUF3943 domain-containing protein [Candidatus Aminicenantes bacterium]|nr:MAG: DUF3943 domain-containing protein [Candidatus Aminicenantes bacterium]